MDELFIGTGDPLREFLAVLAYFLPRTISFMLFFPVLSKAASSNLIKMSVGSALVLYPALAATGVYASPQNAPAFTLLTFMSEVMLGGFLGLTISFPYYAFKGFGALIDVYRGATFAGQVTGNDSGEELPIETLFGYFFAALILAGPGLHALTEHLLKSYLVMPPGSLDLMSISDWLQSLLRLTADFIAFAVLLSGPVLIAILVVEMAVQIIAAFAQQLQVYSVEYSLKSLFGILALVGLLHFAEEDILKLFTQYSDTLTTLLGGLK
jgi:type III secretory pathway component EscT